MADICREYVNRYFLHHRLVQPAMDCLLYRWLENVRYCDISAATACRIYSVCSSWIREVNQLLFSSFCFYTFRMQKSLGGSFRKAA